MLGRLLRVAFGLSLPLILTGCLLAPGKFVSTLIVNADRSFTFSYVGEVIAVDMDKQFGKGLGEMGGAQDDSPEPDDSSFEPQASLWRIAAQDLGAPDDKADAAAKKAATEAKNRAIAEALTKEAGYRKAVYRGDGVFDVDYRMSGVLTHSFIYPFNIDAEMVFPFIALELRANGTVRMKAPAFANEMSGKSGMPGADGASSKLDGKFTLDTDAEIVSQNNEDGVLVAGQRKTVTWSAKPTSKTAPMAVLRFGAAK